MSKRSTTRNPAIAGAIAGILAVALGAWYLKEQRTETAAAVASAQPRAAASVSREQAVEKLMALPELQAWGDKIEKRSGGKVRGALIEYDPAPREVEGAAYYQFTFVENGEESVQAWQSFLVSTQRGDILVEDDISGELLTLDRWRSEKQPLQRAGAQ
jgi:hypothetical protein